ncbi:MAG: hypothetical protein KDE47_13570, partial [Caldilineaceae bacterium]|nr:hypothetical protein [Caldilineaceae bacterium]
MSGLGKLFTTALIAFCSLALLVGSLTCFTSVWAQGNDTTPQASATAADPPERAVTPLPNTAAMSATDKITGDGVSALGTLGFADGVLSSGGDFYLQLTGLPPTPANGQYVLWLLSPITDAYPLATFSTSDGARDLTGTTSLNLPLLFTTAQITLEPRTDSSITATVPPTMSARTVLSATPSAEMIERLRPLLALYGETTGDAEGDEEDEEEYGPAPEDVGALAAAQRQVGIAVQHTGFLRNALSEDDIPQARRHAEHIINILDGKNGFMYGDLDRNGLPENPGDGVGVRVYLAAAKAALPDVADLFTATHQIDDSAVAVAATVDTGQALITDMFDKALQIFAADTVTEANRFAGELTLLVDNLDQVVDDAHSRTLGLVTFSFPGPPRAVTLPAPPPTATPTPETGDEAITATVTGPLAPITAALTTRTTPTATVRLRPTATPGARRSA